MDIIYGLNGSHLLVLTLTVGLWVVRKILTSPTYDDLLAADEREAQDRRSGFHAVPTEAEPHSVAPTPNSPRTTHWTA